MILTDIKNTLTLIAGAKPATITASRNGSAIDIRGYLGSIMAVLYAAKGTGNADNTLDTKIQTSADGSTGWADVTGATFTQVLGTGGTDSLQGINVEVRLCERYIRFVDTVAGTSPSYVLSQHVIGQKATT